MKKITLLLIAAIFAVGIQGCSTDDKTTNVGDEIPENAIKMTRNSEQKALNGFSCFKKIYVIYQSSNLGSFEEVNMDYVQSSLKTTYSTVFSIKNPSCPDIYEWYVPCSELPTYICDAKCIISKTSNLTGGTATHTPRSGLNITNDDNEGDPTCDTCPLSSNYSIVYGPSPSCAQIKESLNLM